MWDRNIGFFHGEKFGFVSWKQNAKQLILNEKYLLMCLI